MIYRIKTEDCGNTPAVLVMVNRFFESYSYECGRGVWKGTAKPSLTLEFDDVGSTDPIGYAYKIEDLARYIKANNKQESILVQSIPSGSRLL